jgi:hypothetical protein
MPDLAVVIVSWNVRELLASCLRSLCDDLRHSALEGAVWVVDNASTDGTPEMVMDAFPAVKLIASDENRGFAAANNLALEAILQNTEHGIRNTPHAWLLNPDTEVQPGATSALIDALDRNPRAAVVGAKLLYPDGSLQHGAFRFPGLLQLAFELFPMPQRLYDTSLNGRYPRHLYEGDRPFPIDHPLGASMLVRAEAIHKVGLMDEGYRMYCEEIDWCWRMREAGWDALCAPTAEVTHYAGQSTSQVPVRSFVNLWTSRARLYARHHGALTWRLAQAMVRVGMRRRMGDATPGMTDACREIIQAWESAR